MAEVEAEAGVPLNAHEVDSIGRLVLAVAEAGKVLLDELLGLGEDVGIPRGNDVTIIDRGMFLAFKL